MDGRPYYKLCENFCSPFRPATGSNLELFGATKLGVFLVNLQEFRDFSGIWDLYYLIVLRMRFLQKFCFLAIFSVFQGYIESQNGPKLKTLDTSH